jgi:hypothetical protein
VRRALREWLGFGSSYYARHPQVARVASERHSKPSLTIVHAMQYISHERSEVRSFATRAVCCVAALGVSGSPDAP